MRKRAIGWELTIKKSDGVRVHNEKKSNGVRVPYEKKSDGVRVDHIKRGMG